MTERKPSTFEELLSTLIDAVRAYDEHHVPYSDDEFANVVTAAREALTDHDARLEEALAMFREEQARDKERIRALTITRADVEFLRGLALNPAVHGQEAQNQLDALVDRLIYGDAAT